MVIIKNIILILLFTFSFSQNECTGHCFTDEEVQSFRTSILELEASDSTNQKIIENLNSQIYMYIQQTQNDSLIIQQLELKNKLQSDLVDLVKPKWYENKYIWFVLGFATFYGATEAVSNVGN
tara:strand:+ start:3522 stop:3890 length:369 start_codon:yes stop_codon:yes gene_type:complete